MLVGFGEAMLVIALRVVGWFGIITSTYNGLLKVFGSDGDVALYAGASRNLDLNIILLAFSLGFLALAGILKRLDKIVENTSTKTNDEN